MQYLLIVNSFPYANNSAILAWQFANQLVQTEHKLQQVFFLHDGVMHANSRIEYPNDELNLMQAWQKLHHNYKIPLNLCISAAQHRGIKQENLAPEFTLVSLFALAEASLQVDRIINI